MTMEAFLTLLQTQTQLRCNLLFHAAAELGDADPRFQPVRGLMLYDRHAYSASLKALYAEKGKMPLAAWVSERYQGLVDGSSSSFLEFQTSCSDDEDIVYKIPTVICRFLDDDEDDHDGGRS